LLNDRDFFVVGVGGERKHSQAMDIEVEGSHFMGKQVEGSSMDESADGGLFPINTELVITGGRGKRNGCVEEIDLLAFYFSSKIYGRVKTIQELEEFGNKITGSSPHIEYVINISPPEGNVGEEVIVGVE